MELQFVDVTAIDGAVTEPEWLRAAEAVHRQLRDRLPPDYVGRMTEVLAGGARMMLAVQRGNVVAIALWRVIENTYEGRRLYVDDLVTDQRLRSTGIGEALLKHIEQRAVSLGCDVLALDSGCQRTGAHRFYFRQGMVIPAFCFKKELKS